MAALNPHPPMVTPSMPYPAGVAGPQELVGFKVSRAAAMCSLLLCTLPQIIQHSVPEVEHKNDTNN